MAPRENAQTRPSARSGDARRALWNGIDQASIMSMELVAAILTWTGIGWLLDWWLDTTPWFMVAGALLGNAAGLYLIWMRSGREPHGWKPDQPGEADGIGAKPVAGNQEGGSSGSR